MKFANKLFFATTAVLTIIFTVFGIWMLSSYFGKMLNREKEQAGNESRMFQYLFEMAYQSVSDYGDDYAIRSVVSGVADSVEKNGNFCLIWSKEQTYYGDTFLDHMQIDALKKLAAQMQDEHTYACGIRMIEGHYFLLTVSKSQTNESVVCLGICKDITSIYLDRQELLNQYRLALLLLLVAGGGCIYILSRYITKPIRALDIVVGKIAAGNYEQRSDYVSQDEIGALAERFNHMADKLMNHMYEKELEAKQKDDFTAAFAHELKTPLTSIIGYADMLNTVDLSEEERREAYYYIYSQGKRLESLSHKLLELVSTEQTEFLVRSVSTKDLEENIRNTMRPILAAKQIKGKISMEKGIIYGDKDLLLSVLYNLLDNAVKAVSEDGFILLKGTVSEQGYEIKVVDNGRGIPTQDINRITEAFYMVDKSRSRKEGGAGIGMALCQKIITLHQGTLRIHSKTNEGTVMKLLFPKKLNVF
uniref:HAMP domain-containing sensor histidine kinase n=1 Tax=Acetatifactor sp. TaxID=1872090 RepID=UPI004057718D